MERDRVVVDLPDSWEGSIRGGGATVQQAGATATTLLHASSFALPAERGTFGAGAVELMNTDDILVVLLEYGPENANTPLFAAEGVPRALTPDDFSRDNLQRTIVGQSGTQVFFTEAGRAFCLYVVLGSHLDRAELVPQVNQILETIQIS